MIILRKLITFGLFPVGFLGVMLFVSYGISQGWMPEVMLASIFFTSLIIVTICERINPEHIDWNRPRGDFWTDVMHIIVSVILLKKGLEYLYKLFLFSISARLAQEMGITLWPVKWPLAVQFVLALIILDFFQYWWHRWSHEVPFLWRFHATHHSPKRLYWVNTGRFHPIDALVSHVIGFGPLILMGISAEALLLVTAWVSADGMFQHCNIRLRFGPLNWIFSTAELHRWHHSVRLSESNTNYGENIILWDVIFGTRFLPGDRDASETVGLTGLDKFPQNYLGQIVSPFKWRNIERASTA